MSATVTITAVKVEGDTAEVTAALGEALKSFVTNPETTTQKKTAQPTSGDASQTRSGRTDGTGEPAAASTNGTRQKLNPSSSTKRRSSQRVTR